MRVSASSVKLARRCMRRWYGIKVLRLVPPEESASTTLGKETHSELEEWIRKGTLPKSVLAAKMLSAMKGYPWWADPKVTEAEHGFEFTLDGVDFHGFMDFRRRGRDESHAVIGDWKTTSNLAYSLQKGTSENAGLLVYVDPKAEVPEGEEPKEEPDVQSSLYAAYEYVAGARAVSGVWVYGLTKPPHTTRVVSTDFSEPAVETVMRGVCADGRTMMKLAVLQPELSAVPCNSAACHDYHRPCPLAGACGVGQRGLFSAPDPLDVRHNGDAMTSFLDAIKKSHPSAAKPASVPPPPPAEDDDLPPPPPEDEDAPPPPPADEEDVPPPPPAEEPHPAEVLAEAAMHNSATRDLSAAVESGFVNPIEAEGKAPYKNPAEAAAGEGVAPVAEKPKAKGRKKAAKVDLSEIVDGDGTTLKQAIGEILGKDKPIVDSKGFTLTEDQRFDTGTGEDLRLKTLSEPAETDPVVLATSTVQLRQSDLQAKRTLDDVPAVPVEETKAQDTLRRIYEVLREHFEG